MASESKRFFFRTEDIGNPTDAFVDVPEDLTWAIDPGELDPVIRRGGSGEGSVPQSLPGADQPTDNQGITNIDNYPKTAVDTPVIMGVISQEVTQDPEGKASIDVTFAIAEIKQTSVEWELRITR